MKAKDLIHELQKCDGETEVAIYSRPTGAALWIPDYDPDVIVSSDTDFAEEYDFPLDTVFITGK
ncbi:MAG TPA: hypothetical protein H9875_08500 [Candidatus Levilactobacillus faecigallinarum]|uniref:Uncharacterized protein n=1 Tax=Candidatus Levilactobacillus faecigallinarum TaxID=2838638 RepID=A0A9D1QT82_9LACO|nr:hypothetical protein [Candidatus Levilactobacillus faecigallinarum]